MTHTNSYQHTESPKMDLDYVAATDAQLVLAILDTGDWELTRSPDCSGMTAAANSQNAWVVRRQRAPFCTDDGIRVWSGPTPLTAFQTAADQLQVTLTLMPSLLETVQVKRMDIMSAVVKFGLACAAKDKAGSDEHLRVVSELFDAYASNIYETALSAVNTSVSIPPEYGGEPREGCGLEGAHAKLEWAAGTLYAIKEKLMRGESLDHTWDAQAITMASAINFVAKQLAAHEEAGRTDTALLDAMERQRIAVVPEHDGPWDATVYHDDADPVASGSGATPRSAIQAAIARQAE